MGKIIFNMTMSLDGYVAGPNDSPEKGLGDNGERLFQWYETGSVEIPIQDGAMVLKVDPRSAELIKEATKNIGAEIWGRKTFNITGGWGGHPPGTPCFIVTHSVPREWTGEGSPFVFVTDGVESAIRQAKAAAGDKDVAICTASILQQALDAGLVDEITVDLVPYLLGGGVRLFDHLRSAPIELEQFLCIQTPEVTHLGFRVLKSTTR
jgi:dihydrofolate reductase